ncbi:hypothetical protein MLD38_017917 [Melastoma candidum]|uniref:Uncharacterized protein n=1 Tax=Melastoma candidum TaxID=119954 RepID=A0ACB9QRC4_9MYRT|nr:hypothetical protein MLD38_017917 [Melastoma candidum]
MVRKQRQQEEEEGMRLGKYEVGRTLGEGKFGKVKFARDVESGQGFAVKIIEKSRIVDPRITEQVVILGIFFSPVSFRFWISLFMEI